MAIVVFEHHAMETSARLGQVLRDHGHRLRVVRLYAGDAIPADLDDVDGVVSMGGTMNVDQADAESLVLAGLGAGEHDAAGREVGDLLAVGVELVGLPWDAAEDRVGEPGLELADLAPADLGRSHLRDLAAERVGDELRAQADADDGELGVVRGLEERALLIDPRELARLIDVHRPAHGDDAVHII